VSGKPWVLREANWQEIGALRYDVAVLPWGATEAHNLHLPYATDAIQAQLLAEESAKLAWERGARVAVLPVVPFGVNTMQQDIPLTVNMNPTTQLAVLADVVESLENQGIARLVVFNAHGGNDFRWMIRELQPQTSVFLCTLNWWQVIDASAYFPSPGDHGGRMETSVMLHFAPELVLPVEQAGRGAERKPRIDAFREGWAWMPRRWTAVTADTGIGDPAGATAGEGARFVAAVTARIAGFFVELAAVDPNDLYQ
jgi:creatinine amidohydrolase